MSFHIIEIDMDRGTVRTVQKLPDHGTALAWIERARAERAPGSALVQAIRHPYRVH